MELSKEKINEIAAMLKHADGEDVQEILIKSGWNEQMLRQLMMCEPINDVNHIYQERSQSTKKYNINESCQDYKVN